MPDNFVKEQIQLDSVNQFIDVYQALNINSLDELKQIYHPNIEFIDPLHQVNGLDALTSYFEHMYENTISCQFDILDKNIAVDTAFLSWQMKLRHKKIGRGKLIKVDGLSKLSFLDGLVKSHRDYFDLTQLIFDHLPLIGCTTRYIKTKAAQ